MTKTAWRTELRQRLHKFAASSQWQLAQNRIAEHVQNYLKSRSEVWASFYPLGDEPQLLPLQKTLPHLTWVFPQVEQATGTLRWWQPGPLGFVAGPWGLWEPQTRGAQCFEVGQISGFLVPGVGFSLSGDRLGRGKGFYDRELARAEKAIKVGVAFDCQVVSGLVTESHDQKVNVLITESGLRLERKV